MSVSKTYLDEQLIRYKEIYPWLKEVNSQSLQQANKNLDNAFQRFFKGLSGYPQRKTKKDNNFSFQIPQHYKINFSTSEILFPVIGWIKVKFHRKLSEEFKLEGIVDHASNSEFLELNCIKNTN